MDYVDQPVGTSITFVREEEQEPLPYVQICSQYWANRTALDSWNVSDELFEYMKSGFLAFNNYKGLRRREELVRLNKQFWRFKKLQPNFDYRKFFHSVALPRDDIVGSCFWQGRKYDCGRLFEPIFTPSGLCHLLRPENAPQQRTPGPEGALRLVIERNSSLEPDVFYNTGFDDGVHMSISGQWTPQLTNPVFVAMGKRAYVQLQRTKFERVKECTRKQNLRLFTHERYSQAGCLHECYVRYTLRRCKCTTFTYNIPLNQSRFCSPHRYRSCVRPLHNTQEYGRKVYTKCLAECPRDCNATEITSSISYAVNDPWRIQLYNSRKNRTWDPSETITVYIYYSQIGHTLIREHWTITSGTVVANLGGQLGLWMGFSALSVTAFFRRYISRRFRKERKPKRRNDLSSRISRFSRTSNFSRISRRSNINAQLSVVGSTAGSTNNNRFSSVASQNVLR